MAAPLSKKAARSRAKLAIQAMDPASRAAADAEITRRLLALDEYRQAATVLAYASLPDEVSTEAILRACLDDGKRLALPRIRGDRTGFDAVLVTDLDLVPGPLNIREPSGERGVLAAGEINLVVVPGRAFDRQGNRVGRGGGMYDRFLSDLGAQTIAIAYACQVFGEGVEAGPEDIQVNCLVTENEALCF